MKIQTIADRVFVRVGSKTMQPSEALQALSAEVSQTQGALRDAERAQAEVLAAYRKALAAGELPPRHELKDATAALNGAKAAHEAAQAALEACRRECATAAASSRVGALRGRIDRLLAQYPLESAR